MGAELIILQRRSGSRPSWSSPRLVCSAQRAGYVPGRSGRTCVVEVASWTVAVASVS
jgi:hypothetical protein